MEERRRQGNKLQLLSQALSAAIHSLNLAKQLVNEIERSGGSFERPGLVGKYNGMFMVTEAGKKYPVPDNYAAKTKLVYGDKLKMVEGPEGRRFKHISKVPRTEEEAVLTMKDGRLVAVASEGSYRLLQTAVRHHNGKEGDKVKILLPRDDRRAPFAAVVGVVGKSAERKESRPSTEEKEVGEVKEREKEGAKPAEVEERKVEKKAAKKEETVEKGKKKKKGEAPPKAKEPTKKAAARKSVAEEATTKKAAAGKSPKAGQAKGGKEATKRASAAKKSEVKKAVADKKVPPAGKAGERRVEPPGEDELV